MAKQPAPVLNMRQAVVRLGTLRAEEPYDDLVVVAFDVVVVVAMPWDPLVVAAVGHGQLVVAVTAMVGRSESEASREGEGQSRDSYFRFEAHLASWALVLSDHKG